MITDEPETVVLVSVDCLRADTAADLPTLSRLADEHAAVTDCHSVGSSTPTSMPGLMQSQLSGDYGGKSASTRLRDHVPTLAERLSEAGVHTAGWHSNVYTSRTYGYNRGFDVFADLSTHSPDTPGDLTDADGHGKARAGRTRTRWSDADSVRPGWT